MASSPYLRPIISGGKNKTSLSISCKSRIFKSLGSKNNSSSGSLYCDNLRSALKNYFEKPLTSHMLSQPIYMSRPLKRNSRNAKNKENIKFENNKYFVESEKGKIKEEGTSSLAFLKKKKPIP